MCEVGVADTQSVDDLSSLHERLYLFCVPTRFTIFFSLFSVSESHAFCHQDMTYDKIRGWKSMWGTLIILEIGSDSPFFAGVSAAELPAKPTWLGTQTKARCMPNEISLFC